MATSDGILQRANAKRWALATWNVRRQRPSVRVFNKRFRLQEHAFPSSSRPPMLATARPARRNGSTTTMLRLKKAESAYSKISRVKRVAPMEMRGNLAKRYPRPNVPLVRATLLRAHVLYRLSLCNDTCCVLLSIKCLVRRNKPALPKVRAQMQLYYTGPIVSRVALLLEDVFRRVTLYTGYWTIYLCAWKRIGVLPTDAI